MIERVHIENFRCLKDVTVELGPLTILVGPNACGKTALLEALDPERMLQAGDAWRQQQNQLVLRYVHMAGAPGPLAFSRMRAGSDDGYNSLSTYGNRFQSAYRFELVGRLAYQLVALDPSALRSANAVRLEQGLDRRGSNLTNVLASLPRKRQIALAEELCRLVPMFRDVDLRPTADRPGHHQLRFEDRWTPDLWYTPEQVSDGTMLTLAFLVLQHQDPPVDLLCIEEPERGLHPWLLGEVLDLLRKLSTGQLGPRPVQVILATHSAELLDHARPEEVRFMTRDAASGAVTVQAADTTTPEWREAYELYQRSLGGLWLAGGLGGVPGT